MPTLLHHRTRLAIVRTLLLGLLSVFALSANAMFASKTDFESSETAYTFTSSISACQGAVQRYKDRYPSITFGGAYLGDANQCKATLNGNGGTVIGYWYDDGKGVPQTDPPMDANTACVKYPNGAALAAADNWVFEPIVYTYNAAGQNGVLGITGFRTKGGTKTYTYYTDCYGKGRVGDTDTNKLPAATPSPAPAVDTAYPKCGAGNYLYTDENGSSTCSQNLPDRTASDCASGNGGYVNNKAVCLPANPAPTVAANSATTAQQKADAALTAGRGTSSAVQAANEAATAYKRAAEAANSMPSSTAAASSAAAAFQSATQAAIAAGMAVPAPLPAPGTATGTGPSGNGTGGTGEGAKECGTPGKPKCQIDETGTPDGKGALDGANDALDKTVKSYSDAITEATKSDGKDTSLGWFPALPSGTCNPFILSSKLPAIDWCPVVPRIKSMMEWMWAMFTIFACIHLVQSTLKGN